MSHAEERIAVTRRSKAVAVVIPIQDPNLLGAAKDKINLGEGRKAFAESVKTSLENK